VSTGVGGLGVPDDQYIGVWRDQVAALSHITRLLSLDDVWSAYLTAAQKVSPERRDRDVGFDALRDLAADMRSALGDTVESVPRVRDALERLPDGPVEQALGLIAETDPATADLINWVLAEPGEETPRAMLINTCGELLFEAGPEMDILQGKSELLAAHQLPDPDLRPLFRCLGTVVGVGAVAAMGAAGIVTVVGIVPTIFIGGAGFAYGFGKDWKDSKCRDLLPRKH
jgi:hypothetical protein